MEFTDETRAGGAHLARVGGDLSFVVAPDLNTRLVDLLGVSNHLIVDLSSADFLDSSIIGVLVRCQRRAQADGGQVALVGLQPTVLKTFDRMGLTTVFEIYDTVEHVPTPRAAG